MKTMPTITQEQYRSAKAAHYFYCEKGDLKDFFSKNLLSLRDTLKDGFTGIFDELDQRGVFTEQQAKYIMVSLPRSACEEALKNSDPLFNVKPEMKFRLSNQCRTEGHKEEARAYAISLGLDRICNGMCEAVISRCREECQNRGVITKETATEITHRMIDSAYHEFNMIAVNLTEEHVTQP